MRSYCPENAQGNRDVKLDDVDNRGMGCCRIGQNTVKHEILLYTSLEFEAKAHIKISLTYFVKISTLSLNKIAV